MWKRKKKRSFLCFACKKKPVRRPGMFCRSCRQELKDMKNGAF